MAMLVLNALLPVVVTLILGAIAGRHHDADTTIAAALNRIVMTYALPLSLFCGTVSTSRAALIANVPLLWALLVGMCVPFLVTLFAARVLCRRDLGTSTMQALAIAFPAVPFIGLPVLGSLFGASASLVVAVSGLVTNILLVPVSIMLLSLGAHPASDSNASPPSILGVLRSTVVEPVVWAPVAGVLMVLFGVSLPHVAVNALQLLGQTTGGISLFASGIILQAQKPMLSVPVAISTLCRLVIIPGVAFLLLPLVGLGGKAFGEAVIALGMPAASILVILSVKYQVAERENASVLLITNILAIPTLATLITLTRGG